MMDENLEKNVSYPTSSTRLSIYELSNSSQMDGVVNYEQYPILKSRSRSASVSQSLSINSVQRSVFTRDSISEMMFDNSEEPSRLQDCVTRCYSLRRGMSCKRMFYDRFPKGRGLLFVLLVNMLESFVTFGAVDGLKERIIGPHNDIHHLGYIFVFFQWCGGRLFYPIAGLIADTCFGRYRMIRIGLVLMWIGFVLITINENLIYANLISEVPETYLIPCAAFILLIFSSASVEANIIPFGVDQIQQGAPSSEISSYFYYYYFSRTAGILFGIIIFLSFFDTNISLLPGSNLEPTKDHHFTFLTFIAIHPLFAVILVTVALILHLWAQKLYYMDRDHSNPLRLIINVLYYAATVKRRPPRYRRAFRYGEEKKRRIELAKRDFDGIFTSEEVEDVKTFFRISLLIFSLSGSFLTFGMTVTVLVDQVTYVSGEIFGNGKHFFLSHELFALLFNSFILIFLFLMTHVLIPLIPGLRIKQKIGLGVVFNALSPGIAMIIQFSLKSKDSNLIMDLLLLILPVFLLAAGHMNVFTAGLEFIYAQSPNSMKGLLTGVFFLWYGIFNGIGIIYFGVFPSDHRYNTKEVPSIGIYFVLATFVGIVSIAMYTVVACIYRNRVRPSDHEDVEDDAVRRGMYGTVSTLNFPDDL